MSAAIYVCQDHPASVIVAYTHDGFTNKCPLCGALALIEELQEKVKELEDDDGAN
jgi:hypothetical protein